MAAVYSGNSGQSMLTVVQQPFAMGNLYKGFCRYRYGCMKKGIRLFCRWTSWESYRLYDILRKGEGNPANGWHYVESGKGLVGRAYSQKKSCFLGNTSQLSMSEYPVVHATRSCGLTACLAIPVQSLDPRLHDLVLEVFLPPQDNFDHENVGLMLQSLLSAMGQNFHRCRAPQYYKALLPLKLEENKEYCVQYSHSDSENFVYFDVSQQHRYVSTYKTLENGREGHHFLPSRKNDNPQKYGNLVAPLNKVERSWESFANGDAENVDGDQVQSCQILGSSRVKEEQLSLPDHSTASVSNSDSNAQEMAVTLRRFANAAVKFEGWLPPSKRLELLNPQSATRLQETDFVEVSGKVIQEPEVVTVPNKRAREIEAADGNAIPASTKGATGIKEPEMGMCPNKRARENEAADANSVSTGAIGKATATGNGETGCSVCKNARENEAAAAKSSPMGSKGKSVALGNDETDRGNNMVDVMATFKDDTILFPLSCTSGIEALRMELDDAIQLGAEKFKLKYKHDDGIWITLLRDKDFRFHIDTLKALGQSTVKLSVFPVPL